MPIQSLPRLLCKRRLLMWMMSNDNGQAPAMMDNRTAPEGAPTPTEGLTNQTAKESGMADTNATAHAGSIAARLDGCPSCVINAEVPFGAFCKPDQSLVALYKCTDCGHRWHTAWAPEAAV